MTERNIFKLASKGQIRFHVKGVWTTEDLWELELDTLDSIYKILTRQLKAESEESLLTTITPNNELLELKVEVIKHIVSEKLEERNARVNMAERKKQKQNLLAILERKENAELENKTPAEIKKMIEDL